MVFSHLFVAEVWFSLEELSSCRESSEFVHGSEVVVFFNLNLLVGGDSET